MIALITARERQMGVISRSGSIMLNKLFKVKVTEFKYIYIILTSTYNKPDHLKSGTA